MAAGNGSKSISDFSSNYMPRMDKAASRTRIDILIHYQMFCKKINLKVGKQKIIIMSAVQQYSIKGRKSEGEKKRE